HPDVAHPLRGEQRVALPEHRGAARVRPDPVRAGAGVEPTVGEEVEEHEREAAEGRLAAPTLHDRAGASHALAGDGQDVDAGRAAEVDVPYPLERVASDRLVAG